MKTCTLCFIKNCEQNLAKKFFRQKHEFIKIFSLKLFLLKSCKANIIALAIIFKEMDSRLQGFYEDV